MGARISMPLAARTQIDSRTCFPVGWLLLKSAAGIGDGDADGILLLDRRQVRIKETDRRVEDGPIAKK